MLTYVCLQTEQKEQKEDISKKKRVIFCFVRDIYSHFLAIYIPPTSFCQFWQINNDLHKVKRQDSQRYGLMGHISN